jgi:choline dehydrogenase
MASGSETSSTTSVYDYVVVGAGSAGAVLAARLTEDPRCRVALLEAGPADRNPLIHVPAAFSELFDTKVDWAYRTVPQPTLGGRRVYWPRGKMLGGSSSINAMMWVRGYPADYEEWGKAAGPSWGADEVLACLKRIEDFTAAADGAEHGVGGPLHIEPQREPNLLTARFLEACEGLGIDAIQTAVTQHEGRRWSTADAYLKPARNRPNLVVHTNALATRVVFDERRATGVEYLDGRRRVTVSARHEVILCGGAVNTPQLLMLSGVGPADHLRQHDITVVFDAPEAGRNLRDHLATGLLYKAKNVKTLTSGRSPGQLARYLTGKRGMLSSNVGEAYGFLKTDEALGQPDMEILFAPVPFLDEGLTRPKVHGFSVVAVLQQPASHGEIRLASADPGAAPEIDPRYLTDPDGSDLATLTKGLEICDRLGSAGPLAAYADGYLLLEGMSGAELHDAAIRRYAQTLYHPVGTCRMGQDARSVVDPELRVRGVEGLRVADASVMPTIIRGHTNAPSIVIGERAADLVKEAWRGLSDPPRG